MAGRREEEGDNELKAMTNRLPGEHSALLGNC